MTGNNLDERCLWTESKTPKPKIITAFPALLLLLPVIFQQIRTLSSLLTSRPSTAVQKDHIRLTIALIATAAVQEYYFLINALYVS